MLDSHHHPPHLDPSELGTKEYWDNYYQNDLDLGRSEDGAGDEDEDGDSNDDDDAHHANTDITDLESWFDDVNAPAKVLEYLTSPEFPLSPNNLHQTVSNPMATTKPTVLDLGTGNGSMLFMLKLKGGYDGPMIGVDYSQQSIDLATRLWKQYSSNKESTTATRAPSNSNNNSASNDDIQFHRVDLIHDDPRRESNWWLRATTTATTTGTIAEKSGFDLVLDKGTFDAISLSSEEIEVVDVVDHDDNQSLAANGTRTTKRKRICEVYPQKVIELMAPGGYLLVTSCNWTEDELVEWFLHVRDDGQEVEGGGNLLELYGKIQYPVYEFGGHRGSGVASVCFRKKENSLSK